MTNKLLPIVPGCRAVVIKGNAIGESCRVSTWLKPGDISSCDAINDTGEGGWLVDFNEDCYGVYKAASLMRIDGGDFESEHIRGMCQDLIDMMDASGL